MFAKRVLLISGFFLLSVVAVAQKSEERKRIIDKIKSEFAPDGRVAIFKIESDDQGNLTGSTNLPEARQALLQTLKNQGIAFQDQIRSLPEADLGEEIYGIVSVSVANIRSNPAHSAELSTQALMGAILKVYEKQGGWYLVQTPDGYLGWLDAGGFVRVGKRRAEAWETGDKVMFLDTFGFVFSAAKSDASVVSDLVAGDQLAFTGQQGKFLEVAFPDGRKGFVEKAKALPYSKWAQRVEVNEAVLEQTARRFMGVPYLWGGTSAKGMDCSGFTKTVYFLNGRVLPRDASQQVFAGEPVSTTGHFEGLKVGDLLFFGTPATSDTREKVTHVGMWLGKNEFIHASGHIRISSVDPASGNYDELNTRRFLRARRYVGNEQGVINLSGSIKK